MKKHLIALDLDGTLLYDWQTLNNETIDFLKSLKKSGHKIVIATGRPFRSSVPYYSLLELDTPIINYNGGLVLHPYDNDFTEINYTIPKDFIIDIFHSNKENIVNAFGEIRDKIYLYKKQKGIEHHLHLYDDTKVSTGKFEKILEGDPNSFIIFPKKKKAHLIEEYIKNNFEGKLKCRSWGEEYNYIIELYTPITSKGDALKYVAEYLNIEKSNIIAIGDGQNDVEMIEFANTGVALFNAHDTLKSSADIIYTKSNKENGVIEFLKEHFSNFKKTNL